MPKGKSPNWLQEMVYDPKRQRTVALVKQAVDALVEQRNKDGTTRVSLNTIVATSRQIDSEGRGVAHTTILENEEAYAYYKRYRTTSKPTKRQAGKKDGSIDPLIKAGRDQVRVRQRYRKLNREELVDRLLLVEQQYAQLNERWLRLNDHVLEWQLRAEQAERRLEQQQQVPVDVRASPGQP